MEPAVGSLRWPRAIAHSAIVVVFLLTALGYVPFRERPVDLVKAAGDAKRAATTAVPACDVMPADGLAADAGNSRATKEVPPSRCERPKAQLASAEKQPDAGVASPDPARRRKAQQAQ